MLDKSAFVGKRILTL